MTETYIKTKQCLKAGDKRKQSDSDNDAISSQLSVDETKKYKSGETNVETTDTQSSMIDTHDDSDTEFNILVAKIIYELSKNKFKEEILEHLKNVCFYLIDEDDPSVYTYNEEQQDVIDACDNIKTLFQKYLRHCFRKSDAFRLKYIVQSLDSEKCNQLLSQYEIKKYNEMKLQELLEMCKRRKVHLPKGYVKMNDILRKHFFRITQEEYEELNDFILQHCEAEERNLISDYNGTKILSPPNHKDIKEFVDADGHQSNDNDKDILNIHSLSVLMMNNNSINDESADDVAAIINRNYLIDGLNISYNKFSAIGVVQVIKSLSMINNIKVLDISGNFESRSTSDNIENLAITLANCHSLQELNISSNLLTFTNILTCTQALKRHPNLQIFNASNNISSYILECEFLVDIIFCTNQQLKNINVCGRNIRPRFNDDCLFFPQNVQDNSNRFALQNLYLTQYTLENSFTQGALKVQSNDFIRVKEKCPISSESIVSYYVDYNGDTLYNKEHDFAIIIPAGAVSKGECVEIQATATRLGQYKLPNKCRPISNHFWVGACYTFNIPVYLIMSHYGKIRNLEDIDSLCALHSCEHVLASDENLILKEVQDGVFFDYDIGYCVLATKHFCSICLVTKNKHLPVLFTAILYTYDDKNRHIAEVCFCPATCEGRKIISKQYIEKKGTFICDVTFNFSDEEVLYISENFSDVTGWSIKQFPILEIPYKDFEFWKSHKNIEDLRKLEKQHLFPPRFRIQCIQCSTNSDMDLDVCFKVLKRSKEQDSKFVGVFSLNKSVIGIQRTILPDISDIPYKPAVNHYEECCYRPNYLVLSSIRKIFGINWKHVGLFLGLEIFVLDNIELNYVKVEDQSFNMLTAWKQVDKKSCYCKLIAAMENDGFPTVAENLKSTIKTKLEQSAASQKETTVINGVISLTDEPNMGDLNKIVIPKIKKEWEDVAFALLFKRQIVKDIKSKYPESPRQCCREVLLKWLDEEHGVGPRTWKTLLEKIGEPEQLSDVKENIQNELFPHT